MLIKFVKHECLTKVLCSDPWRSSWISTKLGFIVFVFFTTQLKWWIKAIMWIVFHIIFFNMQVMMINMFAYSLTNQTSFPTLLLCPPHLSNFGPYSVHLTFVSPSSPTMQALYWLSNLFFLQKPSFQLVFFHF